MTKKLKSTVRLEKEDAPTLERLVSATNLSLDDLASIGVRKLIEEFEQSGEICVKARNYDAIHFRESEAPEISTQSGKDAEIVQFPTSWPAQAKRYVQQSRTRQEAVERGIEVMSKLQSAMDEDGYEVLSPQSSS